jgi:uncharacterized protein (DUF58 family)
MIPTNRLLGLFALGIIPVLASAGDLRLLWMALLYDAVLVFLIVLDRVRMLPKPDQFEVDRVVPEIAALARPERVRLRLRNTSDKPVEVLYRDIPPRPFRSRGARDEVSLPARSRIERTYRVVPLERGDHEWGQLTLRYRSRLGLVWRQRRFDRAARIRVHPDPSPRSREEALQMKAARIGPSGLRLALLRGEGREFESLREYSPDDEYRRIDWKATARKGRLIVRQYEAERDQNVVILLDCGRSMGVRVGDLSKMDHLVEATLRLGRVALEAGDRVGLVGFAGGVRVALAPGKGHSQLRRLAEALTTIQADDTEPDYEAAFVRLRSMIQRRALVVVLTEVGDEESGRPLLAAVRSITPRHLPVVLTVVDHDVARAASVDPKRPEDAYLLAVARDVESERRRLQRLLAAQGAFAAEVDPRSLSLEAVKRYLDIKARGLL